MSAAKSQIWDTSMKWPDMSSSQKAVFLLKNVIALCTFGFVFPNVWD